MADLTAEQLANALNDFAAPIVKAIEDQGALQRDESQRHTRSIEKLATEIRDRPVQAPASNGGYIQLAATAAIIFGLMAPMYTIVQGTNASLTSHSGLEAHPPTSKAVAANEERLKEIETQFTGVREVIELEHKRQDKEIDRIYSWFEVPKLKASP